MQKLFQAMCLALAAFGLSATAQAFTVENMSAWSVANQPLRMDIELSGLSVAYASEVQVRVASEEDHARLGLTRPSWANSVRFQMITLPNYRVVARATTVSAIADDPVSFVAEIRTPSEGRLQQVGSALGLQPIAAKNPAPERTVTPRKTAAPAVTLSQPAPQAKPFSPSAESLPAAAPLAKPTATAKPASAAPAAKSAAVPVVKPIEKVASVAAAATKALDTGEDRAALEAGLKAAKAHVADLEARLAALTKTETAVASNQASGEAELGDAISVDAMSVEATVAEMVADGNTATSETSEAALIDGADDNSQAIAATIMVSDDTMTPVEAAPLKPYQLFARAMILFVGLILLVFFLLDKIRNRR